MKISSVFIIAAIFISGCSFRIADLTVASTKNINLNADPSDSYKLSNKPRFVKGSRVRGDDYVPVILFPLGLPDVEEAADKAIEKDSCAVALSDTVIRQNMYAVIVGAVGYSVEGDLVIDRMLPGCENRK
ncbi:hypothetical protein AC791_05225 [Klebsiella sp. RIT-PI-d]|uniref:hypothetical protein n=1 Tax=Klebsiella sp. RIT-PI-d TaxID=1681196 RepID=UPI00067641C5|nr:hypothetical protein [Klebsiella sp. RIT-PI-d]KNC11335.1 hypothetical protein AC791_05225 [Klebsiella sp. RIT-PI-d]